jgi:hypothetical protein
VETAGNSNLQTRTYKQEIQVILVQVARIGQAGRGAGIDACGFWIGGLVSEAMSSLGCTLMRTL